jgi:hypothetical protein
VSRETRRILAFGPVAIALCSADAAAAAWLLEVLQPSFAPTRRAPDWEVNISSAPAAYAGLRGLQPPDAATRLCFALDQEVVAFPAWSVHGRTTVADAERSCFLTVSPGRVELVGDPATQRWRFTSMWVFHEIVATRLRRTHLDLHAATVEHEGRSLVIVGPKGAGKTTLSFHLLRAGRCRIMANDRAFAGRAGTSFVVRGVPTAVKVRPPTLAEFPELHHGIPAVERPYLHLVYDLARMSAEGASAGGVEFALSPAQLARQLRVDAVGHARLGAIAFPRIRPHPAGWAAERLDPAEVAAELLVNLYGGPVAHRGPTVFEDVDGGRSLPPADLAGDLARAVPGYRVNLGPGAYTEPGFSGRLLARLLPR